MKSFPVFAIVGSLLIASCNQPAQISSTDASLTDTQPPAQQNEPPQTSEAKELFIDVHDLEPGKVKFADVLAAHKKDLATENKYGVNFIKFWVDEKKGKVYCLSSAKDSQSIAQTHGEAHGLLPSRVYRVSEGKESNAIEGNQYFLDVHNVGPGNVTADAAKQAHEKDLAVEKKYGVNFVNYWVDEKDGTIFCLSQAADSNAIIHTHKEAHGLLPSYVMKVKQGE